MRKSGGRGRRRRRRPIQPPAVADLWMLAEVPLTVDATAVAAVAKAGALTIDRHYTLKQRYVADSLMIVQWRKDCLL